MLTILKKLILDKEPTIILGALGETLRQFLLVLVIFGLLQWTGEQVAQVMMVFSALTALITILLTRKQVVSPEVANAQIRTALKMPATASVEDVIAVTEAKELVK